MHVQDAGQAYEALDVSTIFDALRQLHQLSQRSTRTAAVTVSNEAKCAYTMGGNVKHNTPGRTVFLTSTIIRVISSFLGTRYYRLGDLVLYQVQGIPIGGPLCGATLDMVLQRQEDRADHRWR